MKLLLFIFLLLTAVKTIAQVDSLKIKTSVSMQVRDWLYLNSFLAASDEFENVYDSMKVKMRVAVSPTLTTTIKIDSIKQGQIISLARIIKQGSYGIVIFPYTRINAALRANTYLIQKIDQMDTDYTTKYNDRVQAELDKLRSVL